MAANKTSKKLATMAALQSSRQQQQQLVVMDASGSGISTEQMIHVINPSLSSSGNANTSGTVTLPIALASAGLTIPVSLGGQQTTVSVV